MVSGLAIISQPPAKAPQMPKPTAARCGHPEPTWEPPGRTTPCAGWTSTDKRLAIMPDGGLIWTTLNAMQVTTEQAAIRG